MALIDEAVGGITAGLPLVLEADQGAGRNSLFLQMIAGALDRGEQVVFLTAEPPSLLLHQAAAMQIDLEAPLREERLVLLEMDPAAASLLRIHGPGALVTAIRETAPRATFLAINPLSTLCSEILDEPQLRAVCRALCEDRETTHLVIGVESDMLDKSAGLRRILLQTCGAYVRITRRYGPHCTLTVERLRVGSLPDAPIAFRLSHLGAEIEDAPETPPAPERPIEAPVVSAPVQAPLPEVALSSPAEADLCVLVVDDDALLREMYSDWFRDRYRVITARDGSEGLAAFMGERPDLVILDLEMPKVSGFEMLRALGGSAQWVPVIVVSGRIRRPIDRVRPFLLGAADVIGKPPERFDLVRRVDSLIRTTSPPPDIAEFASLRDEDHSSSVLSEPDFRRRMERANLIARRFDIASSLLTLEVGDAVDLDQVLAIADEEMRLEDGLLAVSQSRALFLLVGAPLEGATAGLARLCNALERRDVDVSTFSGQLVELAPGLDTSTWSDFFKELTPWLTLRAK